MNSVISVLVGIGWGLGFSTVASAADEWTLQSTMNVPMTKYGMTWQSIQVRVRVKNLAYEKSLRVLFTDSDGETLEVPATYEGPADAGYETWQAWVNLNSGKASRFSLAYDVAGQSFRSGDFELKQGPMFYAGQNVQRVLTGEVFYGTYANFLVAVRNLAWQKNVQAHYSCDGFRSEATVDLSFQPHFLYGYGHVSSPTAEGLELWSGSVNTLPESCSVLNYYFTYDVAGQRYADTNFGLNYTMVR